MRYDCFAVRDVHAVCCDRVGPWERFHKMMGIAYERTTKKSLRVTQEILTRMMQLAFFDMKVGSLLAPLWARFL